MTHCQSSGWYLADEFSAGEDCVSYFSFIINELGRFGRLAVAYSLLVHSLARPERTTSLQHRGGPPISVYSYSNMDREMFVSRTIFGPAPSEPSLPEQRLASPGALSTPPPQSLAKPARTSNINGFFRLSAEIQRKILELAFGNLIVHLELEAKAAEWHLRGFVCARSPALATQDQYGGLTTDLCLHHLAQIQSLAIPPPNFQVREAGYQIGAMGWLLSCKQA